MYHIFWNSLPFVLTFSLYHPKQPQIENNLRLFLRYLVMRAAWLYANISMIQQRSGAGGGVRNSDGLSSSSRYLGCFGHLVPRAPLQLSWHSDCLILQTGPFKALVSKKYIQLLVQTSIFQPQYDARPGLLGEPNQPIEQIKESPWPVWHPQPQCFGQPHQQSWPTYQGALVHVSAHFQHTLCSTLLAISPGLWIWVTVSTFSRGTMCCLLRIHTGQAWPDLALTGYSKCCWGSC